MTMRSMLRALAGCALALALAGPVRAQEPWRFTLTPIGVWGMGIEGTATVRGITRDLDVGFDEIFDHLQGSYSVNFTATKGRAGGFFGVSYLKVGQDSIVVPPAPPLPPVPPTDVSLKWFSFELGGTYAAVTTPEVGVKLLGGVRYSALKGKIEATDGSFKVESQTTDWIDPFVGGQVTKPIGDRFSLAVRGDIGGFDISENTSKLSWNIMPTAAYRFPISGGRRSLLLSGGYWWNSIDFEGQGPDVFQMDVDLSGPTLALTLVF